VVPYLEDTSRKVDGGKLYVETYGCQMNVNDMEIVLAIMKDSGYTEIVTTPEESDIIFINTCAIRENAEHKIWHRLNYFKHLKSRYVNWRLGLLSTACNILGVVLTCESDDLLFQVEP
jgi:hypothetical protein